MSWSKVKLQGQIVGEEGSHLLSSLSSHLAIATKVIHLVATLECLIH